MSSPASKPWSAPMGGHRRKDEDENRCEGFSRPRGDEVDLSRWPTKVKPAYESRKHYHTLLEDHVACAFSIGAGRCQALSDFSIDPVLISVAGSALLFGIGTEALP
jgi:hypothetical protein